MPSFDIVSEIDEHEVQNAFDQTERELAQRYDFKGTGVQLKRVDPGFQLSANSEERVKAAYEVLVDKFVKRKLSLKFLDKKEPAPAGGQTWRLDIHLKKGIDKENAKKLIQTLNDSSLKVTSAIQGESVRVTGKKKDDLQAVIALMRSKDFAVELSFTNFRD
ncbi:MAG: YajQ family cyclic di-GMP-binding protein [Myxococcaceae bacterium]|nr:YajQ family cyclic di-GMP-binding protein [Myxococcaceae bacterium]MBH2006030.1 YajQ family cyclic di-GMP-binding protein [Myxococcaceae bacterium]